MQFTIFVSTLITDEEGRILLVREKKPINYDRLNLPGGHFEFMEGILDGARREVREEVCVEVELTGLLAVFNEWSVDHYVHFVFSGKILNGGIAKADPEHVKDILWVTEAEFEALNDNELISRKRYKLALEAFKSGKFAEVDLIKEIRR
jgi:ADP-ribose pyrophosphatase YjhB (NUDIX family)